MVMWEDAPSKAQKKTHIILARPDDAKAVRAVKRNAQSRATGDPLFWICALSGMALLFSQPIILGVLVLAWLGYLGYGAYRQVVFKRLLKAGSIVMVPPGLVAMAKRVCAEYNTRLTREELTAMFSGNFMTMKHLTEHAYPDFERHKEHERNRHIVEQGILRELRSLIESEVHGRQLDELTETERLKLQYGEPEDDS